MKLHMSQQAGLLTVINDFKHRTQAIVRLKPVTIQMFIIFTAVTGATLLLYVMLSPNM